MKYPQIRGLQRSGEGEEPACKVPCYSMKEYIVTSCKGSPPGQRSSRWVGGKGDPHGGGHIQA